MENPIIKVSAEGLSFFGTTNRLISHELKNILAIISETLGLLEELVEMSEQGMKLAPGKIRSLNESIVEEIQRANAIIRNMNTFAHSVDEFMGEVDIRELFELISGIIRLDSDLKDTSFCIDQSEKCMAFTSPFFLENLIYLSLSFALRNPSPQDEIRVSLDSEEDDVRIVFSGIASNLMDQFPTKREKILAEALSARLYQDVSAGKLEIILPKKTDQCLIKWF